MGTIETRLYQQDEVHELFDALLDGLPYVEGAYDLQGGRAARHTASIRALLATDTDDAEPRVYQYADVKKIYAALSTALPYIEAALDDSAFKPGRVALLVTRIRALLMARPNASKTT